MKSFRRIFKYLWPQWPRIAVVVVSALLVSMLLSLSFMTLIPLLKVMTGEEGLRGWMNRKICAWQYGVSFDVPTGTDITQSNSGDIAYSLLVTGVEEGSLADKAGLGRRERIVAVGPVADEGGVKKVLFPELLNQLAHAEGEAVNLYVKRPGDSRVQRVQMQNISRKHIKARLINGARWAEGLLPAEDSQNSRTRAIMIIVLFVAIVTVIRCIAKFFQDYMAQKVVHTGINRLREDAFAHVINMPTGFFASERPTDSVSRLVRDTGAMGNGIKTLLGKALREPLNAALLLAGASLLNWQLTVIFLCGGPPTLWMVAKLGRKMKRASRKSLMAWSEMLAKLQETMSGLKVVKVYNQQAHEAGVFRGINQRLLKQLLKMAKVDAATSPIMEVLGLAAGSAALIVGASWVTNNEMGGSEFLVLLGLLGAAAEAVRKTSDVWTKIQEADAAAERVFAMMDQPVEPQNAGAVEIAPLKERIEFRDVVFTYPGSVTPALKGINLIVQAGHNVAVVGPNGSGKTTLANLLPRFYDPDSGAVLIDGKDIRDATLSSLRNQIGMVTQNVVTFNDTIAANIGYGRPGAARQEIVEAAKRAFADEFICPLPDGYDTMIGEQGSGLSGGQLQRIVIARAILKNPSILIFDEATSQVDADSEAKIHNAIEEIMRDRTSFIIAHRFSTVISADVIVVMDQGRVIAQGQHEQLMQSCPLYQSLYETQLVRA
ncbi:MAG TPA: ABC transporter transmembrane domain-containing protein [Sedimentisphaerales bacterium]|nr:ABC transporter transmembrane domain-containing protein [Sedimentisphaerales bacterium]